MARKIIKTLELTLFRHARFVAYFLGPWIAFQITIFAIIAIFKESKVMSIIFIATGEVLSVLILLCLWQFLLKQPKEP